MASLHTMRLSIKLSLQSIFVVKPQLIFINVHRTLFYCVTVNVRPISSLIEVSSVVDHESVSYSSRFSSAILLRSDYIRVWGQSSSA